MQPKQHRKGRWAYGRRVKSSGSPAAKHKRKTWWETAEDRAKKARTQ